MIITVPFNVMQSIDTVKTWLKITIHVLNPVLNNSIYNFSNVRRCFPYNLIYLPFSFNVMQSIEVVNIADHRAAAA